MNTFIGIVLLVLFALDPGAAIKMVPDTVAEEALAAAQEPTAGDATRDEDECTFTWTDPATGRSSCYRLEDERLDFSSAEAHCVVHHGGHLAAITTIAENDNMKLNLIGHEVSAPIWVGGLRIDKDWQWTSGEPFSFADWSSGFPGGDEDVCVSLVDIFWQWVDFPCGIESSFLCESYGTGSTEKSSEVYLRY